MDYYSAKIENLGELKEDFIAPEYFEVLDVREYSSTRVVLGQFKEVPQE